MKTFIAAFLAASLSAAGAFAAPIASQGEEVRVPFLHIGSVREFRAVGRDTVYIQGRGRQWYRATTFGPCPSLPWARTIGVDTQAGGTLDRFSTLVVEGDRCQLRSLVLSEPPPRRKSRR